MGTSGRASSKLITISLISIIRKEVIHPVMRGRSIRCLPRNLQIILSKGLVLYYVKMFKITTSLSPLTEVISISSPVTTPQNNSNSRLSHRYENTNHRHQRRCLARFLGQSWTCPCKLIDRAVAGTLLSSHSLKVAIPPRSTVV